MGWWKLCLSINVQNVSINLLFNVLLCLYLQDNVLGSEQQAPAELDFTGDSIVIENLVTQEDIALSQNLQIGDSLFRVERPETEEEEEEDQFQ